MTARATGQRFRQRKLSTKQNLPVVREHEVEQLADDDASRHIPKVETGVEKGEEIVSCARPHWALFFHQRYQTMMHDAMYLLCFALLTLLSSIITQTNKPARNIICKPSSPPPRQQHKAQLVGRLPSSTFQPQMLSQAICSTRMSTPNGSRSLQLTSGSRQLLRIRRAARTA